jgi:putative phosphoesterase
MKLLVFSDSHGDINHVRNVIEHIGKEMNSIIHLGDYCEDVKKIQREFPEYLFHYVKGNNDYEKEVPNEKLLHVAGKTLLLTHGHKQRVYWGYQNISYWAEEKGADVVLFGHTHSPVNEMFGQVLLFNPGSISRPRQSNIPTFGILEITDAGLIEGHILEYTSF